MNSLQIRILIVDADPGAGSDYQEPLTKMDGIEIVGVARNKRRALEQADSLEFDVMLVDVMLTGYRSMDVISYVATTRPEIHILAMTDGDPPYERVILAMQAGALGYITKANSSEEMMAAIISANQGKVWLPAEETAEVLREAAPELTVTAKDRRDRLVQMLLGILPLSGLIAAFTALLWRKYWGDIDVRAADLGVDASSRMIDVIVFFLTLIGLFGPLIFIETWVNALSAWQKRKPGLHALIEQGRLIRLGGFPIGKLLLSHNAAWLGLALITVSLTLFINWLASLILILVFGVGTAVLLLGNYLGLGDELPEILRISPGSLKRVIIIMGILTILFLVLLSAEVLVEGPDLRTDGVHGFMAPTVLGLGARPARLFDLDGKFEPIEVLYIGGNADLYVLYDPCEKVTRMVPVGSSRVEMIDEVTCQSDE